MSRRPTLSHGKITWNGSTRWNLGLVQRTFDDLRENYILILGAGFSDWLLWFLRLRIEKRLSESRDWYEYLADDRISENSNQVFLRHFSKQTKRYDGGAVKFVDELWRRWTKHRPALLESAPAPLAPEPPRGAIFISYAGEDIEAAKRLKAGLDSAGLEVWFDKAELQGGDTFALKITSKISSDARFFFKLLRLVFSRNRHPASAATTPLQRSAEKTARSGPRIVSKIGNEARPAAH
jgi:hypothetical protein